MYKLLEEQEKAKCHNKEETEQLAIDEFEEEFRFRKLEEDGTYSEMDLELVFKNQMKLYGF